jgi:hypothetical protein
LLLGLVVLAGGVAGGLGVLSMQRLNVVGSLRAE